VSPATDFGLSITPGVARTGALSAAAAVTVAPAEVPVALLPVGLETRFRGDNLLIRVIPDQIHVEDHEPGLTDGELAAGRAFWRQVWRSGTAEPAATDAERTTWIALVGAIGNPRRAAWVADQSAPPATSRPSAPTPAGQPLPEPPFSDPPTRASAWTRAAVAGSLPDAFVAIAYRRTGTGGTAGWVEIGRAWGEPIAEAVQLGLDPSAPAPPITGDGPPLPDAMKWMVDPAAAEQAGLLITVALPAGTATVDRLVVLGVAQSVDTATSAARLTDLLAGHHYTSGLEVMAVGTPTNNTAATRSGYTRIDDPVASFDVERRTTAPPEGSDGSLLARALGIAPDTLAGVAHSGDTELAYAGHLNALVWPSAFGYWFDSLLQPGTDDHHIHDIRDHLVRMVRGRGPLPPLRVGRQPYGVLPVTSLRRWQPATEPAAIQQVVGLLQTARSWWLDGVAHAPVVRAGADPEHGMLDVLGQAAVSTITAVRSMVGANVCFIPFQVAVADPSATGLAGEANRQRWLALLGLRALGFTGFPYIGQLVARPDPIPLLHLPYTVNPDASDTDRQAAWAAIVAYLTGLRSRTTADLQKEDPHGLTSLLTLLAHRSVMLERVRFGLKDTAGTVAGQLVEAHLRVAQSPAVDAGLIATTATLRIGDNRSTVGALLAGSMQRGDGTTVSMLEHLDDTLLVGQLNLDSRADYAATVEAAEMAARLDPDRAALLLGEALDVASHRFDAWVTSLATRRLADLRAATPAGITLGAYGVVEDLVRAPARPAVTSPPPNTPTPLSADPTGAGYIHAPSLAQATTAAVLRSGHLSHASGDPNSAALSIDLSSSRVRTALALLDGVRQGQPLGALLGYRLERKLHDLGAHTAVEVVRALAPPPVVTATGSPEGIPPRTVCDGLALSRLDRTTVLTATQAAGADTAAVTAALDALDDTADAVADLLLAEGVHQIVIGNPDRASAALDALNRGDGAIPEPTVVKTPRTGTSLTHRVLVALGPDTPPAAAWPVNGPRAIADPLLAAWAGHLLGDPTGVTITVTAPADAGGAPAPPAVTLSLADLGVGALDVVYEPLLPRILRHARARGAAAAATPDPHTGPIAAMLATAEMINGLLVRARAGTAVDLARAQDRGAVISGPPSRSADAVSPFQTATVDVDQGRAAQRLAAARTLLADTVTALPDLPAGATPDEVALAAHLDALGCFGIYPGGDPGSPIDAAALASVKAAAVARLTASAAAPGDPAALFGDGFPVTTLVAPPPSSAFASALAHDPIAATTADALTALGGPTLALQTWLETHGTVRPGVGRLTDVLLAARLRGTSSGALRAVQLPVEPFPSAAPAQRGQWVGMAFPSTLGPEPVTDFVMQRFGTLDPAAGMAVLVIDEFTEVVPAPDTTTGISFGFDAPGARPPQSVLLAVPPVAGQAWTVDALAEVVGETVDLAKIRMVDLSSVAWAGRFIPTIYLTDGDIANGIDVPMKSILTQAFANLLSAVQP
jgi:hypothetical protein